MKHWKMKRRAKPLSKYQQMIRNIINANKVAKTKLITRNGVIDEQDTTIDTQEHDIKNLNNEVAQKKAMIRESERKIAQAKSQIAQNKNALKKALDDNKISEEQYETRVRKMQEQGESKIKSLQAANRSASQQLKDLSANLQGTEQALEAKQKEAEALKGETKSLRNETSGLKGQIAAIKGQYEADKARSRQAFEAELNKGKLDAAERARREGEFRADAERKEKDMQGRIAGLSGQLKILKASWHRPKKKWTRAGT